jgi:tripartite-type tricarboxylate transporter receptor subunit TctC
MSKRLMAVAIAATVVSAQAAAQTYPSRAVRIVVGFPPGGGIDIAARAVAQPLSESFKQSFVVDNRPGGSGIIASEIVARSKPDGYTLLMASMSHVVNPGLFPKLPYDTVKDFAPITLVGVIPNVYVVHPSLPVTTLKGLVDMAKRRPGQITFSAASGGSSSDFAMQMLVQVTRIEVLRVPYKGAIPSLTALLSGEVAVTSATLPSALPFIANRKLRVLAASTAQRSPVIPDVPTVAESGYPGFSAVGFTGLLAPANTPGDITAGLGKAIADALKQGELGRRFRELGFDPAGNTPEQFDAYIKQEIVKWTDLVKKTGMRPE